MHPLPIQQQTVGAMQPRAAAAAEAHHDIKEAHRALETTAMAAVMAMARSTSPI